MLTQPLYDSDCDDLIFTTQEQPRMSLTVSEPLTGVLL